MNILIGEITSYKAIVIAKYIKQTYPESIIFTYDYRNYTRIFRTKFSDKHFLIKKNDTSNFKLKEIIIKYNIEFFFPVINNEIKKIWKHKNDYGESLKYLGTVILESPLIKSNFPLKPTFSNSRLTNSGPGLASWIPA